ncbi:MAG TPA: phage tail protein [Actinocrinis sp.]|uniref:phage tail protein n=1 Tax=Actinocrinis sp. TaxID=1920516 RepID=UPI002DDDB4FB|nr:phage tail protein [Actinocrinis sp.]HEV2344285.1 phage tail protein [Actinocrinis sp.]
MRGLISEVDQGTLGVTSAVRQAIPAVYQEDPLYMQLCAAFDDLMAPLVTAVDCFDAYLDPRLAPADFLPWLADLVGYQEPVSRRGTSAERGRIAGAVRDHARRGTAPTVREAAAHAAGVPVEQVELDDPGGTRWSTLPGGVIADWPHTAPRVRVTMPLPTRQAATAGADRSATGGSEGSRAAASRARARQDSEKVLAAVRAAIEATAGVHCGIEVELVAAGDARSGRERPPGARSYGGES